MFFWITRPNRVVARVYDIITVIGKWTSPWTAATVSAGTVSIYVPGVKVDSGGFVPEAHIQPHNKRLEVGP